jgi:hypothetical protein
MGFILHVPDKGAMNMKIELLPLVDMDGILTQKERKRIIKRLHSALSWVGSRIPKEGVVCGEYVDLREAVIDLISKEELTKDDLECAKFLSDNLLDREADLEDEIIHGKITEEEALALLEEARGLLRAIQELENLEDRGKKLQVKDTLLARVDDEKRWKYFIDKLKK